MAEIQKPSDQNRPDDSKAGKLDALNPERGVSNADVGKAEKQRVNKFTTFGQMTTVNDSDCLDEARARQSALDNPLTIDFGDGNSVTSEGFKNAPDHVIAGNPFTDSLEFIKKTGEKIWHPDSEHPDIRMNYIADLEAFQATGLAKYGIDPLIIAATIRNEIVFREAIDGLQDELVQKHPMITAHIDGHRGWSVGDIQMRRSHMEMLINASDVHKQPLYPQLATLRGKDFESYVPSRGEGAALVGAYFQDVASRLDKGRIPTPWYDKAHTQQVAETMLNLWKTGKPVDRTEALIRSFNPGEGARHVEHVREQMKQIRSGPAKLFE